MELNRSAATVLRRSRLHALLTGSRRLAITIHDAPSCRLNRRLLTGSNGRLLPRLSAASIPRLRRPSRRRSLIGSDSQATTTATTSSQQTASTGCCPKHAATSSKTINAHRCRQSSAMECPTRLPSLAARRLRRRSQWSASRRVAPRARATTSPTTAPTSPRCLCRLHHRLHCRRHHQRPPWSCRSDRDLDTTRCRRSLHHVVAHGSPGYSAIGQRVTTSSCRLLCVECRSRSTFMSTNSNTRVLPITSVRRLVVMSMDEDNNCHL